MILNGTISDNNTFRQTILTKILKAILEAFCEGEQLDQALNSFYFQYKYMLFVTIFMGRVQSASAACTTKFEHDMDFKKITNKRICNYINGIFPLTFSSKAAS